MLEGACHLSVTAPSPGSASRFRGADGATAGVAVSAAISPPPTAFTARTSKAYPVPLTRLPIVTVSAVPTEVHAVSSATEEPSAWRYS